MTKLIQAFVVVLVILSGIWVAWKGQGAAQQPGDRALIVKVDQLPAPWNDLVPLKCYGTLAMPNEIKTLSCVLSNGVFMRRKVPKLYENIFANKIRISDA